MMSADEEAMKNRDGTLQKAVSMAFLTACLLTASTEQSEVAVTKAIGSWNAPQDSEVALIEKVINAAMRIPCPALMPDELRGVTSDLPFELRAVLELPTLLRHCFISRVLVGLQLQDCVRLLKLQPSRVTEYTNAAIESLAATRCGWNRS